MENNKTTVVLGLGEVGKPLLEVVSARHNSVGIDVSPTLDRIPRVDVMHVCYPFEIKDFVGETARYIEHFKPAVTIINSTIAVGTTRAVADRTGTSLVHSPVRGKHIRMLEELRHYDKFIGAMDNASAKLAVEHFESSGIKTRVLSSPEATELAKLTETTYFGLIIAWAQEVERYCDQSGQDYSEIASFWEEIKFLPPVKYFPGVIGGHCVLPNIEMLSKFQSSQLLNAIQASNSKKIERESRAKAADNAAPESKRSESLV